jgi:preprotein translocase subunit YajC
MKSTLFLVLLIAGAIILYIIYRRNPKKVKKWAKQAKKYAGDYLKRR